GLALDRRRINDDIGAEVRPWAAAGRLSLGQCAGSELGERVAPAVGQFHIVAGLAAATVANHQVGTVLSGEAIDRGTLALVSEGQTHRDDRAAHDGSWTKRRQWTAEERGCGG